LIIDLPNVGWKEGRRVSLIRGKRLLGRADIQVSAVVSLGLNVIPAPIPENPNHANITGWPLEKSARMSLAQEIVAAAGKAILVPGNIA
jgi:hypothetical protein